LKSHDGFVSEGFFIRKNGLLQNKKSLPDSSTYSIFFVGKKQTPEPNNIRWVVNIFWIRLTTRNEGKVYLAEILFVFFMENQRRPC
jgi:hypothetical protein